MNTLFSNELLCWYDSHKRTLPWRMEGTATADPYHVWMSEIMLQQTTVATVKSYFTKFLKLWPTVESLAEAQQELVLKEWAGLGYYAHARNLHKCAQAIVADHGGIFPANEDALRALPGIGDYTAAAIAAIAFKIPAAVVDGNIERIISRIHRIKTALPAAKKEIKAAVAIVTPAKRPGDFAQAMMDLGASLCSPKKPSCLLCPVSSHCASQTEGDMETYPVKPPKKIKPTRRAISYWLVHDGHILLERRAEKGLLGGMPGLYSTPWIERSDFPTKSEWLEHRPSDDYFKIVEGEAKHTFTHFHLLTQIVAAKATTKHNVEGGFWHPIDALDDVGLPTVFKKIVAIG